MTEGAEIPITPERQANLELASVQSIPTGVEEFGDRFDYGERKRPAEFHQLDLLIKRNKALQIVQQRGYFFFGVNGQALYERALAGDIDSVINFVDYEELPSGNEADLMKTITKKMKKAHEIAQLTGKPVIIFFNQGDGLFVEYGLDATSVSSLLSSFDGKYIEGKNIFVIGATNHQQSDGTAYVPHNKKKEEEMGEEERERTSST